MGAFKTCTGGDGEFGRADNFMPMYQTCSKLAKGLGEDGYKIMNSKFREMEANIQKVLSDGFSKMRAKLMSAHTQSDMPQKGDISGFPSLLKSSKLHIRKGKAGSPVKKKTRRK